MQSRPDRCTLATLTALAALALAACGPAINSSPPEPVITEPPSQSNVVRAAHDPGKPLSASRSRSLLASAVRHATLTGRDFTWTLSLPAGVSVHASGHRNGIANGQPGDASRATMRIDALILSSRASAVIAKDHLYLRTSGRWFDAGSASGTSLDVGRELMVHEQLIDVTGGRVFRSGGVVVRGRVSRQALRSQLAQEPAGPVSQLLSQASGIRFSAGVRAGRLEAVTLDLRTPLPAAAGGGTGRVHLVEHGHDAQAATVTSPTGARPLHQSIPGLLLGG